MRVRCISDDNRPNEVPSNRWIKKDEEYTVFVVCRLLTQNILAVKLEEINNDDLAPWSFFRASRFIPIELLGNIDAILEKAIREGKLEEIEIDQ